MLAIGLNRYNYSRISSFKSWCAIFSAFAMVVSAGLLGCGTAEAETDNLSSKSSHANGNGLANLGACISRKQNLDVVLLIDETGSLVHGSTDGKLDPNKPGSDPEHTRVPAAQSFVDQLLDKQAAIGFSTQVRVSGFGEKYKSGDTRPNDYADWRKLDNSSVNQVKSEIGKFSDRTGESYTNYKNALEGASEDLLKHDSGNPCRMIVTFTDGALAPEGDEAQTEDALCQQDGVVDKLRIAGITNVAIGLSGKDANESSFDLLKAMSEGSVQPCGVQPPNGAFFSARNVGDLFAAFSKALSTGGDVTNDLPADSSFDFWLDDSIDSVRFSVVAHDDLGPNAVLVLRSPSGKGLKLESDGKQSLGNADVTWRSTVNPVQQVSGMFSKKADDGWSGKWSLQFEGLTDSSKRSNVFNSVEMSPGLKVVFRRDSSHRDQDKASGEDSTETDTGQLSLHSTDSLQMNLVDAAGKTRPMKGKAVTSVDFVPRSGDPISLGRDIDMSSGKSNIDLGALGKDPHSGEIRASTTITTAGEHGQPGTELKPIVDTSPMSVTPDVLPTLPGEISFKGAGKSVTVDVPVSGPGKVWVQPDSKLQTATVPDGMESLAVSSKFDSSSNAVELKDGENSTIPISFTPSSTAEGAVSGEVRLNVSSRDGAQESIVPIAVRGNTTLPVNKTKFTIAVLLAIAVGLAVPLLVMYIVRYIVSKIPNTVGFGVQRFRVRNDDGVYTFDGNESPVLDYQKVAQNQAEIHGRSFVAGGASGNVKSLGLNPLTPARVVVGSAPSLAPELGQSKDKRALLPLALPDSWYLERGDLPGTIDLVVLPRVPLDPGTADRIERDITEKIDDVYPAFVDQLEGMQEQTSAMSSDLGGNEPVGGTKTVGSDTDHIEESEWGQPVSAEEGFDFSDGSQQAPAEQPFNENAFGENPFDDRDFPDDTTFPGYRGYNPHQ